MNLPTCTECRSSTFPAATDHGVQAGGPDAGWSAVEVKQEQKASEDAMAEVLAAACIDTAAEGGSADDSQDLGSPAGAGDALAAAMEEE